MMPPWRSYRSGENRGNRFGEKMKKKILQTISQQNLLEKDMHIVVGLSGGPDSMCMFDVLCSMAAEWNLRLYPVHVNHKFRPGAAEADQAFVEEVCRQRGWPARTFVCDCNAMAAEQGLTSEEAGRKARYDAFRAVAADIAAGQVPRSRIAIAVAQNAEDQAETILFRILRGTGITGLSGIAYKRYDEDGNMVIRPLLDCSRADIEAYCRQENLNPRHDHTNEEPVYTRNRIRLQLLPYLKGYNPNIIEVLTRLGRNAAEDDAFLQQLAREAWEKALEADSTADRQVLSIEALTNLHPALRKRVYHIALQQIGLSDSLSAAHLAGIGRVLESDSPSARWNLPKPYTAEKQYGRLILKREEAVQKGNLRIHINPEGPMPAGSRTAVLSLEKLQEAYGIGASEMIELRQRRTGDWMAITTGGMLHRKKLQDMLVDMKVPKSLRDDLPLAAIGSEILWILPGEGVQGRISAACRVSEPEKESIIVLEYLS